MLALAVPALAAALVASAPFLLPPDEGRVPSASPSMVQARAARHFTLEPRGTAPVRLRELSMRGERVSFGQGSLEAASEGGRPQPFVLKHTDVRAEVTGFVSSVTVTQEFDNPFTTPVEAIYVFPLPDDAAVDQMTLTAGERVIRATIQKREEARRLYEEAKAQGRRAALLDQERPNIFTQSVANLLPGERVKVTLHYVAPLRYDDGLYTFNFPMVVGRRYIPGEALAGEAQGSGVEPDTDRVLDASRISPPEERTGRDINVTLKLDVGAPVEELLSPSHRMNVDFSSQEKAQVTLAASDRIPNKDFILRWKVTGPSKRAALLATGGRGGTFALMLMPESAEVQRAPVPKEMVFVIDTSCSMAGAPLDAAKRAMRSALEQMNPDDTFMLIDFADRATAFHDSPLPNIPSLVSRATSYLSALPAAGGTNQLAGLLRALQLPKDPQRLRLVLLMTDGFIGNESEILAAAERELGEARVFGFGVGANVNHYLLTRLSTVGRGFYQYIRPDEDPEPAVERFVRRIERPLLTDISIDWGKLEVFETIPSQVPDLFDAEPLRVVGRYREPGRYRVTLSGVRNGAKESTQVELEIPSTADSAPGLASLWARAKIEGLERRQYAMEQAEIVRQITALGLEHHVVTAYTSLVAVDDRKVAHIEPHPVAVPSEPTEPKPVQISAMQPVPVPVRKFRGPSLYVPPEAAQKSNEGLGTFGLGGGGGYRTKGDEILRGKGGAGIGALGDGTHSHGLVGGTVGRATARMMGVTQGSIDREVIARVVNGHLQEVRGCYERALLKHPGLSGKVVAEWFIEANGKVKTAKVKSTTLKSAEVEACILNALMKWTFPKPPGGAVVISYPFLFNSVGY